MASACALIGFVATFPDEVGMLIVDAAMQIGSLVVYALLRTNRAWYRLITENESYWKQQTRRLLTRHDQNAPVASLSSWRMDAFHAFIDQKRRFCHGCWCYVDSLVRCNRLGPHKEVPPAAHGNYPALAYEPTVTMCKPCLGLPRWRMLKSLDTTPNAYSEYLDPSTMERARFAVTANMIAHPTCKSLWRESILIAAMDDLRKRKVKEAVDAMQSLSRPLCSQVREVLLKLPLPCTGRSWELAKHSVVGLQWHNINRAANTVKAADLELLARLASREESLEDNVMEAVDRAKLCLHDPEYDSLCKEAALAVLEYDADDRWDWREALIAGTHTMDDYIERWRGYMAHYRIVADSAGDP